MTGESDNLPSGGTDTAQPFTFDDAMKIEFDDPQDEDTVEGEEEEQSAEEPGEVPEDQEAEEPGAQDEEQAEESPEPEDDVHVTVNGEKLALSQLKSGYMRQADYTRKTQELGNKTRDLDALSARVTNSVNVIAEFLVKQIPEAPNPQLAMTNPGQFVQQKALHEAATAQVNALLEQAGQVKDVGTKLSDEQRKSLIEDENAKLAMAFPQTATDEGRKKFFDAAASAARELGFSDEEIGQSVDHRMFALAHYAKLGMQAEQAKAKAKAKVVDAPPVALQRRPQGPNAGQGARNKEAMKKLARTGSINDAMLVDFE